MGGYEYRCKHAGVWFGVMQEFGLESCNDRPSPGIFWGSGLIVSPSLTVREGLRSAPRL